MVLIGVLLVAAWTTVVQANSTEINSFTMICNPPLKFTTVANKKACITKCVRDKECDGAVFDYNQGVTQNNCALITNKDKCGPAVASLADPQRASFLTYSNYDDEHWTEADQMEVDPNVGALAPIIQGGKKSMTTYIPFTLNENKCFHLCKMHSGCNGYAYGSSKDKTAVTHCVLKAFSKPVGNDGKCIPGRVEDGVKVNTLFFGNAKQAPEKECA